MARDGAKKPYVRPALRKRQRLAAVTEKEAIVISGRALTKGGCFSNSR